MQCHICNDSLAGDKVRDHDHVDEQYRGAAHAVSGSRLFLHARFPRIDRNVAVSSDESSTMSTAGGCGDMAGLASVSKVYSEAQASLPATAAVRALGAMRSGCRGSLHIL